MLAILRKLENIHNSGNAVSTEFAGLYPRPDIDARPRRGDYDIRDVQLFCGRGDALYHAADADDYFGNTVREFGISVVY